MSPRVFALLAVAAMGAAHVLQPALRRLVDAAVTAVAAVLGTLTDALEGLQATLTRVRREHVGGLGLRALLGSLLVTALTAVLVWADFTVTVATLKSLLPIDPDAARPAIFGHPLGLAESSAIALVGLHVLAGVALLEALGLTRFFPLEPVLPERGRRALRRGACLALLVLAMVGAGLAAWRTDQMRQLAALHAAPHAAALDLVGAGPAPDAPQEAGGAETPGSWLDTVPVALLPIVAFLLPVATAGAGIGLYFLPMSLAGALLGVLAGAVAALTFLARVLGAAVTSVARLLTALIELIARPVEWAIAAGRAAWQRLTA